MTLRTVLDTNVVLSALVFSSGVTARLRQRWQNGDFIPLASTVTVKELIRVLAYPQFGLEPAFREELLADYLPFAEVVDIPKTPPEVPSCRDVFDLAFLHLAVVGKADALVSGDRDLLVLAPKVPFLILTPAAFEQTLPGT